MSDADNVSRELLNRLSERNSKANEPLPKHGGDGTSGGMDQVWKKLDDHDKRFDRAEDKLDSLRIDMAVIKERVSHLPTKGWAFTIAAAIIGVTGTLVTLAPKIQQVIGIIPR